MNKRVLEEIIDKADIELNKLYNILTTKNIDKTTKDLVNTYIEELELMETEVQIELLRITLNEEYKKDKELAIVASVVADDYDDDKKNE